MNITRTLGYTVLTITTIGISQVIGVCGLFFTACKAVYDHIQYARYLALFQRANKLNPTVNEKLEHYRIRKEDNKTYAKAFTASLVSLSLNHALGFMEQSFAAMVSDVFLAIFSPESIRQKTFPLNGQPKYVPEATGDINPTLEREFMMKEWGAQREMIRAGEDPNRAFEAFWIPLNPGKNAAERPTVIVIPGRASVLEHNKIYAEYYRKRGMNVLLYSLTGYPGSLPLNFKTTELSLYEDAEAAIGFVKRQCSAPGSAPYPNERVLFHGISMGGAAAVDATSRHEGTHLITDISFSSGEDTAKRYMTNSLPSLIFTPLVVNRLARDLARTVFGFPVPRKAGKFQLNCFNSAAKITAVTGTYFSIYSKADPLMNLLKFNKGGKSTRMKGTKNASVGLLATYNGPSKRAKRAKFEGGHNAGSVKDEQVAKALEVHLKDIGFVA